MAREALPVEADPRLSFFSPWPALQKLHGHTAMWMLSLYQKAAEAALVDFQHWGVEMFTTSEKIGFVMRHLHLNASRPLEVELRFHICTFSMCECKALDWALLQKHLQILEGHRDRFRLSGSVIGRCHVMD